MVLKNYYNAGFGDPKVSFLYGPRTKIMTFPLLYKEYTSRNIFCSFSFYVYGPEHQSKIFIELFQSKERERDRVKIGVYILAILTVSEMRVWERNELFKEKSRFVELKKVFTISINVSTFCDGFQVYLNKKLLPLLNN